jgi:hypothetical protein
MTDDPAMTALGQASLKLARESGHEVSTFAMPAFKFLYSEEEEELLPPMPRQDINAAAILLHSSGKPPRASCQTSLISDQALPLSPRQGSTLFTNAPRIDKISSRLP